MPQMTIADWKYVEWQVAEIEDLLIQINKRITEIKRTQDGIATDKQRLREDSDRVG